MIIYRYRCTICGRIEEITSKEMFGSDDKAINCSKCGGLMRRVYNEVSVLYKGKGFHSTDYRKASDYESE